MHAEKKIRLHVVSRFPVYRHGLAGGLERCQGIDVTGAAAGPADLDRARDFDVLLTDLSSTIGQELILIRKCARNGRRAIVLGTPEQAEEIYAAISAGASACISKTLPLKEIAEAIVDVGRGRQSRAYGEFDAQIWGQLKTKLGKSFDSYDKNDGGGRRPVATHGLTATEARILEMTSDGRTNKEIAAVLGVSERTVRRHLTSVFHKIGVRNRTAAIAWVLRRADRG